MIPLADFLIFLFDEKKLLVSTIKGYGAMLSQALSFRNKAKVCRYFYISEMVKAFELQRPVSRSLTPKWDLSCVFMVPYQGPI